MNRDISDTADIETSSDEYARRFSGKTGEWMLQVQTDIILSMLRNAQCKTVLDVGGGHGQLALPLSKAGFNVTVLGSAEKCKHRILELVNAGKCRFTVGSISNLLYSPASFDAAISIRLMAHCLDWRKLVSELCRVAKKTVIVDYPPSSSFNMLAPSLFGLKKRMEGNTRKYRIIGKEEVRHEFEAHGFTIIDTIGEFFLPMVLHRITKSRSLSSLLENFFSKAGLTRRFGSPVILYAVKKYSACVTYQVV